MKSKTRSSIEINAEILRAVKGEPLTRSKIMYQTMLNFRQVCDYGTLLQNAGILEYTKEEKKYRITENGRSLLKLYEDISKLLNTDNISHANDPQEQILETETVEAITLLSAAIDKGQMHSRRENLKFGC